MGVVHPAADFETAMNAFYLFSLDERRQALEHFANLRYASIDDRFFEAVYRVIAAKQVPAERAAQRSE